LQGTDVPFSFFNKELETHGPMRVWELIRFADHNTRVQLGDMVIIGDDLTECQQALNNIPPADSGITPYSSDRYTIRAEEKNLKRWTRVQYVLVRSWKSHEQS